MEKALYQATGRRKSSVARVRLVPGTGKFEVNGRNFVEYIPSAAIRLDVLQPLNLTATGTQYDIYVKVNNRFVVDNIQLDNAGSLSFVNNGVYASSRYNNKGNISVGGIVGHGYPKMENCSVVAEGTIKKVLDLLR